MIAYFVPSIYPCTTGGLEVYYYHLINAVSKSKNVLLFTTCKRFENPSCKKILINSNLFIIKKYNLGKISLFITTFFNLLFLHRKIRVIHVPCTSNSGFYGYFFPFIKTLFGIPYVIQFHGGGMRPWKKWDGNRMLFKHADKVLVVSNTIKTEYEKRAGREIQVVLPLIPYKNADQEKEQLKLQYGFGVNDLVILMVGSIKPLKGNFWVYDEFKNLLKEVNEQNDLRLLFVGEGSDSALLKLTIARDNMGSYVRIIDKIPNENIHEIYGLADLYVIGSDFEGTPKSLLEALFNGLPIIGTDVNGINSIITDGYNGLLVNKNTPGNLTNVLLKLIRNNELAERIGSNAKRTYLEKFDFSITLEMLSKIYQDIAEIS